MGEETGGTVQSGIPDGAIRIYRHRQRPELKPSLVVVKTIPTPHSYGVIYIQFPERGEPSGGSGWTFHESCFSEPVTLDDHLMLVTYLTAKRVKDLRAELANAEANVEAVKRFARLTKGGDDADPLS